MRDCIAKEYVNLRVTHITTLKQNTKKDSSHLSIEYIPFRTLVEFLQNVAKLFEHSLHLHDVLHGFGQSVLCVNNMETISFHKNK